MVTVSRIPAYYALICVNPDPQQHRLCLLSGAGHKADRDVAEDAAEEHRQPDEMQRLRHLVYGCLPLSEYYTVRRRSRPFIMRPWRVALIMEVRHTLLTYAEHGASSGRADPAQRNERGPHSTRTSQSFHAVLDDAFNRTCVAGFHSSCHSMRMPLLIRSLLALLLAVTLIGATISDVSAGVTAEIVAATEPCCDGDCPDDPACGTACAMIARGGMATLAPLQAFGLTVAALETAALLLIPDQHAPSGLSPDGLRRPPRI